MSVLEGTLSYNGSWLYSHISMLGNLKLYFKDIGIFVTYDSQGYLLSFLRIVIVAEDIASLLTILIKIRYKFCVVFISLMEVNLSHSRYIS